MNLRLHKDFSFWLGITAYVSLNIWLILQHSWMGLLIPGLLLLLITGIFSFDKVILFTTFCIPLSVRFEGVIGSVGLDLPTDPLILFLGLLIFFKFLGDEQADHALVRHPLTIILFIHLVWLFISACTSSMPIVSFKFLASRLLFVLVFYWAGAHLFSIPAKIHQYLWLYMLPLTWVVFFTLYRHYGYNLDQRVSYGMSQPFYVNHGIYAAALAMFIPYLTILVWKGKELQKSTYYRTVAFTLLLIFLVGLVYSFTRAAWISIAGAAVLAFLALVRLKPWMYGLGILMMIYTGFQVQEKIENAIRKNQQVSADSFDKHLKSIYNIKNDDSNLERINRWKSAFRMTADRPIFGFGCGTYVFQYAPYQRAAEITKISTNFGTLGNAHSEFLQPLAETGVPGFLIFLIFLWILFQTAFRLITLGDTLEKNMGLALGLGLATYFIHGLLNNYSDLDKAASLIWGFAGALVALDLRRRKRMA